MLKHSPGAQFACFFLICTTSLLKIRWLLGTAVLTAPLVLVYSARALRGVAVAGLRVRLADVLPHDADVHLTCAWATGALMSFLADSYRRWEALPLLLAGCHGAAGRPPTCATDSSSAFHRGGFGAVMRRLLRCAWQCSRALFVVYYWRKR